MQSNSGIGTVNRDTCIVCKSEGSPLYQGLKDQLFSVPGEWNLVKCDQCGLIWLNPAPRPDEQHKIYGSYYTHQERRKNFLSNAFEFFERSVFGAFGYSGSFGFWGYIPYVREYNGMKILGIRKEWGTRLLDVGCGNGEFMSRMKSLGWNVEGTETDDKAVDFAQNKMGLKVHSGILEALRLPENTYDVITISHVIEHVTDPETLLRECLRILRPGGRLVMITPNTQSLAHRWFKKYWRGFEIPRHMVIFSVDNFGRLSEHVGFESETLTSTARMSRYLYSTSVHMKQGRFNIGVGGNRGYLLALKSYIFQAWEEFCALFNHRLGEEIYFVGKKKKQ